MQRQHISEQEWSQYNAKGKQAFLDKIKKEGKLSPGKSIHHMTVHELDALHQEYLSNEGHLLPIEEYGFIYAIKSVFFKPLTAIILLHLKVFRR